MDITTLVVKFLADNQQLLQGVGQIQKVMTNLDNIIKSVGLSFAIAFGKQKANEFVDLSDRMNKLSKATRESTDDLQKWENAVKIAGGDSDAFSGTVKNLADELNLLPFNGAGGKMLGMFSSVGIMTRNAEGQIKKPLELLTELSDKMAGMGEAKSLTFGTRFGLDENTVRIMQQGRDALKSYLEQGKSVGILSQDEIKRGAAMKRTFNEMQAAVTFLGLRIGSALLPAVKLFNELMQKIGQFAQKNERLLKSAFLAAATVITAALIPAVVALGKAMLLSIVSNPILLALAAISAAIMLLVDDFLAFKEGAESFFDWGGIIDKLQPFIDFFNTTLKEALSLGLDILKQFALSVGDIVHAIVWAFHSLGEEIGKAFAAVVSQWDKISGFASKVKGWFGFGSEDKENGTGFRSDSPGAVLSSAVQMPSEVMGDTNNTATVNNANRTTTIQNVNITAQKVDSANIVPLAEKAAGSSGSVYQQNFALGG